MRFHQIFFESPSMSYSASQRRSVCNRCCGRSVHSSMLWKKNYLKFYPRISSISLPKLFPAAIALSSLYSTLNVSASNTSPVMLVTCVNLVLSSRNMNLIGSQGTRKGALDWSRPCECAYLFYPASIGYQIYTENDEECDRALGACVLRMRSSTDESVWEVARQLSFQCWNLRHTGILELLPEIQSIFIAELQRIQSGCGICTQFLTNLM